MRVSRIWADTGSDVRQAVRQLAAAPAFTVVAALTLALGVGVNSAIFALADAALIRPLPFGQTDRLVMLWERTPNEPKLGVAPLNMRDWIQQTRSFEAMGFVQRGMGGGPVLTAADGSMETAERQTISTNFFDVLQVKPLVGRTFRAEDETASRAVVLGEAVWRRRFGANPGIVGQLVRLNGQPYTVVGVVADAVQFSRPAEIWTLSQRFTDVPRMRAIHAFDVVARLKPGVSMAAAAADLDVVARRLAAAYPETNKNAGVVVQPLRAGIVGSDLQTTSLLMLGVVGFVLLLCCANVANLLLARATARAREIAVRTALGAERGRIVRQLLTESLVLAAVGGVAGVGIGATLLGAAPALIPSGLLPAVVTPTLDARVVVFGIAAACGVGIIVGLIPAWQATAESLTSVMGSQNRSVTSGGSRLRRLIVSGEVAAAVLLLCGAGLLLQTMLTLLGGDTGYRSAGDSVLTLDFSVPTNKESRYPTPEAVDQFYRTVSRDVAALAEVRHVGWASSLPYGTSELGSWIADIEGAPVEAARDRPTADFTAADPGYFATLDLPVVRGRGFTEGDTAKSPLVCLVNEAFARRYFPGRNPVGARLVIRPAADLPPHVRQIVGVARQTRGEPDAPEALRQIYVPLAQFSTGDTYMVVQPRTGSAEGLTPLVRRAVARVDPDLSVRRDRTLEVLSIQSTAGYRFRATLVATFAGLALLLAMVGVFGVLAYAVQQRRREIGVRMALGATSGRVMWAVFRDGGAMVATGAIVGVTLAALSSRLIATFLFGVDPLDPLTFLGVPVVILGTALVAAAAPAWRASRIDPVVAFRQEP